MTKPRTEFAAQGLYLLQPTKEAAMATKTVPQLTDLTVFISRDGNELVTDSRAIAVAFGKAHKDVLRIINRMLTHKRPEIAQHAQRNFAPYSYTDPLSRQRPMYRMTAKGMAELTMGSLAMMLVSFAFGSSTPSKRWQGACLAPNSR